MVVLPFVPVTPSTRIARRRVAVEAGATGPSAARTLGTAACGTSSGERPLDEQRDRTRAATARRVVVAVGARAGDAANTRRASPGGCRG